MSKRSIAEVGKAESDRVSSVPIFTTAEEVSLKVMSIMKEAFGTLPKAFWDLSHSADLLAPRGFIVSDEDSFNIYNRRLEVGGGYPIVSLRIKWWRLDDALIIIPGNKVVNIESHEFNGDFILNEQVEEVIFDEGSAFNMPVELPPGLKKIQFGAMFHTPVTLPSSLKELVFSENSDFDQPITLPSNLKNLVLGYEFDTPITPFLLAWNS